jgi:hypothetical protein
MQHPGCVHRGGVRRRYSDGFRQFIVHKRIRNEDVALEAFADLAEVPVGTLKMWMAATARPEPTTVPRPTRSSPEQDSPASQVAKSSVEAVLLAWRNWHGDLGAFAHHVREDLGIPYGRQLIARILTESGERPIKRRGGRSPDEIALRKSFETFFPGAQWVGDGKTVGVRVDDELVAFNLELQVDAHTGAFVGLDISDVEDGDSVVQSFEHGVETTGAAPLSELLDNKACNHTQQVRDVLEAHGTMPIRATPKRPQNKAHVEGAFGLFSQMLPTLELDTRDGKRGLARSLLFIVALTWARTLNHRPRRDRGGLTRVELYAEEPTEEQIQEARRALEERCRKQELAQQTLQARQRPEVRKMLDESFARLDLADPDGSVRLAIAGYPTDAITAGIAIYAAKQRAGSLPDNVTARYLLGIVRNVAATREGELVLEEMIRLRLDARNRFALELESTRIAICDLSRPHEEVIEECVARACASERPLDRTFWLRSLADFIIASSDHAGEQHRLLHDASIRILASFSVTPRQRHDAVRFLTERVVPFQ